MPGQPPAAVRPGMPNTPRLRRRAQRPSAFAALIARRQELSHRNSLGPFSDLQDSCNSFVDLALPLVRFGHNPGDRAAVPSDDQSFAPLDLVEELRQMSLGLGSLNLAHSLDQSIRLV